MNEDTLSKMVNSFRAELAKFATKIKELQEQNVDLFNSIQMLKRENLSKEARMVTLEKQLFLQQQDNKKLQAQVNDNSALPDDMVNMGGLE